MIRRRYDAGGPVDLKLQSFCERLPYHAERGGYPVIRRPRNGAGMQAPGYAPRNCGAADRMETGRREAAAPLISSLSTALTPRPMIHVMVSISLMAGMMMLLLSLLVVATTGGMLFWFFRKLRKIERDLWESRRQDALDTSLEAAEAGTESAPAVGTAGH